MKGHNLTAGVCADASSDLGDVKACSKGVVRSLVEESQASSQAKEEDLAGALALQAMVACM